MRSPKKSIGTLLSTVLGVLSVGALAHLWIDESLAVPSHKHGAVMARSVVTDPETNQPILVEYGSNGEELREVPIPQDYKTQINQLKIISAATYRQEKKRLDDYKLHYQDTLAKGAELLSKAQYLQRDFLPAVASAETADDLVNGFIKKPTLSDNVKSVLVRAEHNRLGQQRDKELVLLTFSVNLAENYDLPTSAKSVVLSPEGNVITTAPNNIAYRVGFYGNATDPQAARKSSSRTQDDTIFGPVGGIRVSVSEFAYPGGIAATDSEGKYRLNYFLPPCPVGGFEFTTDVYAELRYQNFRPSGSPTIPYFLRRQDWDFCYPNMVQIHPLQPPVYFPATPIVKSQSIDLWVDVMFLTGLVNLKNPDGSTVAIGDKTEYHSFAEQEKNVVQKNYDFNGDGTLDFTYAGVMQEIVEPDGVIWEKFVKGGEDTAEVQAVYFEEPDFSADAEYVAPDLVRLIDQEKRLEPAGYLKSISRDDYQNTDILVFRESTGELVVERIGLRDEEIDGRAQAKYYDDAGHFFYSIMLRGPMDFNTNIGGLGRGTDFAEFNTKARLSEPYQQLDADHLKPGESVRIIAINRATGYMGSARVQLGSAGDNPGSLLNTPVDGISMTPPNLKVWAERDYTVEQGLTKDEDRSYVIGAEGASLTSDQKITIYTEWLDQDGTPLPEGLSSDNGEQYGYTGRLAKVVSNNVLEAASDVGQSDLAEFPIAPGKQLQVLTINSNLSVPEHYYIHINGTAKDEGPDFAAGSSVGALAPYDSRPAKLTPFLSPLFDENSTWQTLNDFKQIVNEVASGAEPTVETEAPAPTYAWNYRPEYQFSQYELEMQEVKRKYGGLAYTYETDDQLPLQMPAIASSDDLVEALYTLLDSQFDRLSPIDGPQQMVLALGEEEVELTLEENKTLKFSNIDQLSELSAEDLLTMRLYTNNDAGNVLWEFAFEFINLYALRDEDDPVDEDGSIIVTADQDELEIRSELVGYSFREDQYKNPHRVKWSLSGGGSLETYNDPEIQEETAFFSNVLTIPKLAGSRLKIESSIRRADLDNIEEASAHLNVLVVPGVPASITIEDTGDLYVEGKGEKHVNITVRDAHGNLVEDGTPVELVLAGSIRLKSNGYDGRNTDAAEFSTVNGKLDVYLKGTEFPESSSLTVLADKASANIAFDVQAISMGELLVQESVPAGSSNPIEMIIYDGTGEPITDTEVLVTTNFGRIVESSLQTDGTGKILATYIAPDVAGQAQITARVGLQDVKNKTLNVYIDPNEVLPDGTARIGTHFTKMVGDRDIDGEYQYTRYDTSAIRTLYRTNASAQLFGNEDDHVSLQLGTLYDPNRHMLAAYWMDFIHENTADDDVGFSSGTVFNVTTGKGNIESAGDHFKFDQLQTDEAGTNIPAYMYVESAHRLLRNDGLSFATAIKLEQFGGEVLNLGDGLTLESTAHGTLVLTLSGNDAGGNPIVTTVESQPITLGTWHKIAARFYQGKLTLEVNNQAEEVTTTVSKVTYQKLAVPLLYIDQDDLLQQEESSEGELSYLDADLQIGSGMQGQISSLKWFDWRSAPLVTFDNGQESVGVDVDNTGYSTVNINSNNKMQSFGGRLTQQRVAITSGDKTAYVSLLSYDYFSRLTQFVVDSELINGAPPINEFAVANGGVYGNNFNMLVASGLHQTGNFFINSAYAYDIGFWDVVEIVGSLVGLDSVGVIWDQLGNMVAGRDVDIVAFSVAVLDLLTLFPPAAPLKIVVTPAKLAIRLMNRVNGTATKYLAGALKRMYDKAKKRDFDLIFQGIATFIVLADMFKDEEAREGLSVIVSTINSTDDLINWFEFISLADPELLEETAYNMNAPQEEVYANNPLSWVMGSAYASKGKIDTGVGARLGKALKELAPAFQKVEAPSQSLGKVAKVIRENPKATKIYIPYIFNLQMLRASIKVLGKGSVQQLRGYLTNYNGRRIPPLTQIMVIAFLEEQVDSGELFNQGETAEEKALYEHNIHELRKLYMAAAPALVAKEKRAGAAINKIHGASFHLLELAKQQLLSQASSKKVVGIEIRRLIRIFNTSEAILSNEGYNDSREIERKIDILTGSRLSDENWIEVKSWKAKSKVDRSPLQKVSVTRWVYHNVEKQHAGAKGSPHRQFITDRIALKNKAKYVNSEAELAGKPTGKDKAPYITVSGIQWLFLDFKAGVARDIVSPDEPSLRKALSVDPSNLDDDRKAFTEQVTELDKGKVGKLIDLSTMVEFLNQLGAQYRSDMLDAAISEVEAQL
ncbi:hypothetical protein ACMXYN_04970 [Neptuniibacter sp. PT8_73]|uniref:hypothetical protein n=1 Tax=Neptuniibacter sp. PT8_73 TaxID=3398206 RepID=UPI0039F45927